MSGMGLLGEQGTWNTDLNMWAGGRGSSRRDVHICRKATEARPSLEHVSSSRRQVAGGTWFVALRVHVAASVVPAEVAETVAVTRSHTML